MKGEVAMNAFDKIIGYEHIKKELQQISDTLKNREAYEKLGVHAPRGLLLYGEPGVGKSSMASAVVKESGRKVFTCRKDSPNGDFVKKIKAIFDEAAQNEPSIVYLDDMDKFANDDEEHPDAQEYVTVQSCIDEVKEMQVFVLATANDIFRLPDSLLRAGRFDRTIEIEAPRGQDAVKIVSHYLKSKNFMDEIDPELIGRIMDGRSCAELETVINEAGLYAGYERESCIKMKHLMKACMRTIFGIPAEINFKEEADDVVSDLSDPNCLISQIVYHEAGHAVIHEVLCPESVTLISAYSKGRKHGGFTNYYNDNRKTPLYWDMSNIISLLGGMAAIEQKFGIWDNGCRSDLLHAFEAISDLIAKACINGFHLYGGRFDVSENLKFAQEQAVSAAVAKYYQKAKEILSLNFEFLEKISTELAKKKLLSAVDVQRIKSECKITSVTI